MTDIETKNIILPPNGSFLSGNLTLSNYEQILERENSNLKNRIKELEDKIMKHQTEFDQIRGMKSLAIGLWTILAGGLGLVIVKVFEVIK